MHAHEIAERLRQRGFAVERHGKEFRAQCPAHGDRDSGLNLWVADGDTAVRLKCHSHGCAFAQIAAALDLTEADFRHGPRAANGHAGETTYTYYDEAGQALYEVRRSADKQFTMWKPGAERPGIGNTRRVLFGLPGLLRTEPGSVVGIAEGEKCAMALSAIGLFTTTNPNGAGTWRPEYTDWLKEHLPDRHFLLFKDNDAEGRKHMVEVGESLEAAGLKVSVADLGDLNEKEDVVEWLARGGTLEALLLQTRPQPPKLYARLLTFAKLLETPAPVWMVDEFAFERTMLEIFGPPNEGKTFVCMDLCRAICQGTTWCGREVMRPGPVLYVNADGGPGFADRARAWVEINGSPDSPFEFWTLPEPVNLYRPEAMAELSQVISYLPEKPVVLVIDTYSRCIPGVSENVQEVASQVVDHLTGISREYGCSPWLIHHTDKTGKHDRGSSVILGACDTQIRCTMDKTTKAVTLTCEKQRDSAYFEPIGFDLARVPGTNETWITWRPEGPGMDRMMKGKEDRKQIIRVIAGEPGITRRQLYLGLEMPAATLKRHLTALIEQGKVAEEALPGQPGRRGPKEQGLFLADEELELAI